MKVKITPNGENELNYNIEIKHFKILFISKKIENILR